MDFHVIGMREEVDYKRRLFVMKAGYVRQTDSGDLDTCSVMPDLGLCCMYRPLAYCWFVSFLPSLLEHQDFEGRLRQVLSEQLARVPI